MLAPWAHLEVFDLDPKLTIPSVMADVASVAARPPDVSLDISVARNLNLPARAMRRGFTAIARRREDREMTIVAGTAKSPYDTIDLYGYTIAVFRVSRFHPSPPLATKPLNLYQKF